MKKILITGGTGFIGSHLAEFFAKKKYIFHPNEMEGVESLLSCS